MSTFGGITLQIPNSSANPPEAVHVHPQVIWLDWIESTGTYDLFITIGFRCWLDMVRAVSAANHLLTRVNRSLYGKNYKKRGLWLSGIGVVEFKLLTIRSWASPHFHFALKFPSEAAHSIKDVRSAVEKGAVRLRYPTYELDRPFSKPISAAGFVDVQAVYNLGRLSAYLAKELGPGYRAIDGQNIFFVDGDGFEVMDARLPTFRY